MKHDTTASLTWICLLIGIFCVAARIIYTGLMTSAWLFYVLPGLAVLGLVMCIVITCARYTWWAGLLIAVVALVYVAPALLLGSISWLILPAVTAISMGVGLNLVCRQTKSDKNLNVLCVSVALLFFQFGVSLADVLLIEYAGGKPWPFGA